MTPAIELLKKQRIEHLIHQYEHDVHADSYGLEAVEKLGVDQAQVYKTLVVQLDGKPLAVAILPVSCQLSLKLVAKVFKAKRAVMADPAKVQRSTGYVLGGVSPLGQKKRLPSALDATAENLSTIFVSAGKRGLEIELAPADLVSLLQASVTSIVA